MGGLSRIRFARLTLLFVVHLLLFFRCMYSMKASPGMPFYYAECNVEATTVMSDGSETTSLTNLL